MYTYCPGEHLSYIAMPEHSKFTSWLDFLSVNTLSANLLLLFCNSTMSINFSTQDDISLLPSNKQFSKGTVVGCPTQKNIKNCDTGFGGVLMCYNNNNNNNNM